MGAAEASLPSQRQRLLDLFAGRRPERIPWVADLTYWQSGRSALGTLPPRYRGEAGLQRLHEDTGAGRTFYVRPVVRVYRDPDLFHYEEQAEGDLVRRVWHTPAGTLRAVYRGIEGGSLAPVEWPVKTVRDLEAVCAWAEGARYQASYEGFHQSEREWGDMGYPFIGTARTPLAALVAEWAGVEGFTYLVADEPLEVERSITRLRQAQDSYYELLAHSPGAVIEIGDNLSATVQASFFRRYSLEYYQERAAQLHAAGKKVGVHIDGTLRGLLHQLPQAGLDFVEAVTPAPVGDMGFEEIRSAVGPECIVIGGMPGAMFAPHCRWPEIQEHVRRAMTVLGREGRFALGVADQVPPDGELETVRRISREVDCFSP
ncbi:MAG: hypothetical protein HPY83_02920 [Anaerolineae bacterium]|nr:hypothetical protein [Anaerolineae bacterium]